MTTTLITGAARGLGRETARQLIAAGHRVWISDRDGELGAQTADELGGRFVKLDVRSDQSVRALRETLSGESGGLDVLVNNAGIGGGFTPVADVAVEDVRLVYETNVLGVVRLMQHLAPLLARSPNPVVVNVSSGMGSFGVTADSSRLESRLTGIAYPSSKAALNMLTVMYARAYPQIRINSVDPGQTQTDMTGGKGGKTVEQGAGVIVAAAQFGPGDTSGSFFDESGTLPW
jgi:NAD(P)-dependent dehydrogenase (short-subunit alcohol dehydrogenase family)